MSALQTVTVLLSVAPLLSLCAPLSGIARDVKSDLVTLNRAAGASGQADQFRETGPSNKIPSGESPTEEAKLGWVPKRTFLQTCPLAKGQLRDRSFLGTA